MKQKLILTLALFIAGIMSVNAQVTIGSDSNPHDGAILDLQSTNKGVLFPKVYLEDVNGFQLADNDLDADGMVIYNTNTTIGLGLYFWNGTTWMSIGSGGGSIIQTPNCDPLTGLKVDNSKVEIELGETATFTVSATSGIISYLRGNMDAEPQELSNAISFKPNQPGTYSYIIYVNGCGEASHQLPVTITVNSNIVPEDQVLALANGVYERNHGDTYASALKEGWGTGQMLPYFTATNKPLYIKKTDVSSAKGILATAAADCGKIGASLPNIMEMGTIYELNSAQVTSKFDKYWSTSRYNNASDGYNWVWNVATASIVPKLVTTTTSSNMAAARCVWYTNPSEEIPGNPQTPEGSLTLENGVYVRNLEYYNNTYLAALKDGNGLAQIAPYFTATNKPLYVKKTDVVSKKGNLAAASTACSMIDARLPNIMELALIYEKNPLNVVSGFDKYWSTSRYNSTSGGYNWVWNVATASIVPKLVTTTTTTNMAAARCVWND